MISSAGNLTRQDIAVRVLNFEALGETPIGASLRVAGQAMLAHKNENNTIVLVTDGIEECGGDPCYEAAELNRLGIGVKVHVVGFALALATRTSCGASSSRPVVHSSKQVTLDAQANFGASSENRRGSGSAGSASASCHPVAPPPPPHPRRKCSSLMNLMERSLRRIGTSQIRNPRIFGVEKGKLLAFIAGASDFARGQVPIASAQEGTAGRRLGP